MCTYENKNGNRGSFSPGTTDHWFRMMVTSDKDWKQERKRLTCPVCKRRMIGWVVIGHDADIIYHAIPPHKKKKWWKKKMKNR